MERRPVSAPAAVIVRAPNWLGDTVMALPALRALRALLPDARIALAGPWAPLLAGQGVADVLLPYPRAAAERRRLNRALAQFGADLAVLLPSSFEAALAARRWRARRVIGFDADCRRLLLTDPVPVPSPRRHQADEYGLLLEPLGAVIAPGPPEWRLAPDPEGERDVQALLDEAGLGRRRMVGLHLGAALGPSKRWAADGFARVAERLDALGLAPVLLGSEADTGAAAAVLAGSRGALASLVGRDRPAILPRLLSRLACLVSGDTGVAHLAAAVGVPTVTLFGPTDPRLTAPRSARGRVIYRSAPCSPCFLATCPIEHVCMAEITPDAVEREVRSAAA